ncbi:MAG: hypothetical protein ACO3K7_04335 [Candidatus Marinamargulisbacteria bacterium]
MPHIIRVLFFIIVLGGITPILATEFKVSGLTAGPNPIVRGKDPLIINYTATTFHESAYAIYTITGELMSKKSYASNTPQITHAGECFFQLFDTGQIATLPPQLYIIIMQFKHGTKVINKKQYVVIK